MLTDINAFRKIEKALIKSGQIAAFEAENGKITGHMMILPSEIPEGIEIKELPGKMPQGFEASFDFYDAAVGIGIYTNPLEPATDIWILKQREDAEEPSDEWISFFIEKLAESIGKDGAFGFPICVFVNDEAEMTVVPAPPV